MHVMFQSFALSLLLHSAAASIWLSISPQIFPCGEAVTASYSYTSSEALPLTLFLKGQLSLLSSASIVLPNPPARNVVVDFSWTPSGCEDPGSWFFFIQDYAYFATSSNNAPVSIKPVGSSGFRSAPLASPTMLSAGMRVTLTYSTFGAAALPVSPFIVGATAYQAGATLGSWESYPLEGVPPAIPAAGVSSGSYYIVARTASGMWSDSGAPVTISLTPITVSPLTFRAFDTVTISWPAAGIIYPAQAWIQKSSLPSILAVSLGPAIGSSLTTQVTLKHVSMGDYLVYLAFSGGGGYSATVVVNVLPYDPNVVASSTREDALVAYQLAFLAYQSAGAIGSWNTSQVCTFCAACEQAAAVSNVWAFDATNFGDGGAGFLVRRLDGVMFLSFEGTADGRDGAVDANAEIVDYAGCLAYASACGIHAGFYGRYNLFVPLLRPILAEAIPSTAKSSQPIVIVGHSLGGAVATIAAFELSLAGYLVAGVYTFGSPRVGNAAFSVAYGLVVGRASPEFYDKRPLRRAAGGAGRSNTVRPSLLLLEAVGLPASTLDLPDDQLWAAWDAAAPIMKPRSLAANVTPGAGNAAGAFRGSWRVANCGDPVTALPPESLGYVHVDTLIQVNSDAPLTFDVGSNASCTGGFSSPNHAGSSYLFALGGSTLAVDSSQLITYRSNSALWVAPGGALCSSFSTSQTPSQTPTTPTTPSSTPSVTGTPSLSPTPTNTPSASPSSSLTPSVLPTPPGLSGTPSVTLPATGVPSLSPISTLASPASPAPASSATLQAGTDTSAESAPAVPTATVAAVSASLGTLLVVAGGIALLSRRASKRARHVASPERATDGDQGLNGEFVASRNPLAAAISMPAQPPGWHGMQ
jgi:hypothetical protein